MARFTGYIFCHAAWAHRLSFTPLISSMTTAYQQNMTRYIVNECKQNMSEPWHSEKISDKAYVYWAMNSIAIIYCIRTCRLLFLFNFYTKILFLPTKPSWPVSVVRQKPQISLFILSSGCDHPIARIDGSIGQLLLSMHSLVLRDCTLT